MSLQGRESTGQKLDQGKRRDASKKEEPLSDP
jgi:hypothetical protein